MNSKEFVKLALKTESNDFESIADRLIEPRTIRLLHAAMGLVTEAAEFMDAIKKYTMYGKPLDNVNLMEELGDSDWYKAIAVDELGLSFEEIWDKVIEKLKVRYGIKFNKEGAISRDLSAERYVLEKRMCAWCEKDIKPNEEFAEFLPRHFIHINCRIAYKEWKAQREEDRRDIPEETILGGMF